MQRRHECERMTGMGRDLYDLCYFYAKEEGKARYTCEMARQALISVYRYNQPNWNSDFNQLLTVIRPPNRISSS